MASSTDPEPKITGFAKYYNSSTTQGRANVALTTIGGLAALGLYLYFKPKKSKQVSEK
ncbi:up-regulated during skeletal muscle growth protein 5-like [Apis mellifera]|uniref:Up-regulated during skeletal muscle growth protein 5-like n=1 Tax=Apis mellifera TaxID=7460 RepID=A0A7M7KZE0_APIME|nr:up-regulated during skeletal muscle growth protein 5-like [Apis mellifera]|eukprot:XP_026295315.1 up-regulated during skeletal muscle growth protein 5-like [Apis mellifera]